MTQGAAVAAAISTPQRAPFALGLLVALFSAATFGSSGTFGASLLATGWSPGAIVTLRICGAALVLLVPTVIAMRGQWHLLRRNALRILAYGLFAVAGCQFAYFMAVDHLSVGVALLLEYLAPVLIVAWVWARHGRRPSPLTMAGVAAAVLGLVLVLEVASGAQLDLVGVLWGLLAAVGLVIFFLVAADEQDALPPIGFAGAGLAVGAVSLLLAAGLGLLPMSANTSAVDLAGWSAPWWVPIIELALVAGAVAYVSGIAAARLLGGTVASFVGLSEVLFAVVFAWLIVGEAMSPVQIVGGVAVLAGVVAVKLGEGGRPGPTLPTDDVDAALLAAADEVPPTGFAESERVH
jgi:drug/metabolite transporter (DMT)-like permease